ncbi:MAG: hypothetical protein [Caudoviricetes sp.]|nr:MAG: hypothetical protein [Caudoviricetes sp.]
MKNKDGIKVVESIYNPKQKSSFVRIQTPRGEFFAYVYLHPEDKAIATPEKGKRIAKARAMEKYYRVLRKEVSEQIKAMENFKRNLECSHRFKKDSYFAKRLEKEIQMLYGKRLKIGLEIIDVKFGAMFN